MTRYSKALSSLCGGLSTLAEGASCSQGPGPELQGSAVVWPQHPGDLARCVPCAGEPGSPSHGKLG